MEFISSDTNVWIDFKTISRINLPFRLPYTYIMYKESMEEELLSPGGLKEELETAGLIGVDITIEEFMMADRWGQIYKRLSVQDRIALAIAKYRNIILLTGDKALREAAEKEDVRIMGTLGILDELYEGCYVTYDEYMYCLRELEKHNGREIRLPKVEIRKRIESNSLQ